MGLTCVQLALLDSMEEEGYGLASSLPFLPHLVWF